MPRVEWGGEGQVDGKHGKRADVECQDDALYAKRPVERHGEAERGYRPEGCDECHSLQATKPLQDRSLACSHAEGDDHRCQQRNAPDSALIVLKEYRAQQRSTRNTQESPEHGGPNAPSAHDTHEMTYLLVGTALE